MVNYWLSLIFGAVQGLTEFWPVSSSGHLLIMHELFHFEIIDSLSFDVALHLGTLLALLVFFWSDVIKYLKAFGRSFMNFNPKRDLDQRLAWLLILATIPAGLIGLFLENIIESMLRNLWWVAGALIIVAVIFLVLEKIAKQSKDMAELNWWQALLIGLAQAIALIPGVSRSGITIIAGMALKLKRETAARFSFLLSIPIVFGAGLKKIYDVGQVGLSGEEGMIFMIGLVSAAVIGYLAVKYLLRFLTNHSLNYFAYYRLALGLALIAWLIWA